MSIRRAFQIVTFIVAMAFAFSVPAASLTAYACDPSSSQPGLC